MTQRFKYIIKHVSMRLQSTVTSASHSTVHEPYQGDRRENMTEGGLQTTVFNFFHYGDYDNTLHVLPSLSLKTWDQKVPFLVPFGNVGWCYKNKFLKALRYKTELFNENLNSSL